MDVIFRAFMCAGSQVRGFSKSSTINGCAHISYYGRLKTEGKCMRNDRRRRRTSPPAGRQRTEEEYVDYEETDESNALKTLLIVFALFVISVMFCISAVVFLRLNS